MNIPEILESFLIGAAFCLLPALVLRCCARVRWLGRIGPVLLLYLTGILIGNAGLPQGPMSAVQTLLSNATVPLAIPLMLFGCHLRQSISRAQLLALLSGLLAVVLTVAAGYLLFGRRIGEGAGIGGMLTGVYTGGTVNLAALKAMLGVRESTYVLINSYDMLVSFLYLAFLLGIGIRLFRRILPTPPQTPFAPGGEQECPAASPSGAGTASCREIFSREGLKSAGRSVGLTLLVCAVSGGAALLLPEGAFMPGFILLLTTLGIAGSFFRPVRDLQYSYDIGMYLIYIFCIAVASMADFSSFDFAGGIWLPAYIAFVVFGSLLLQLLFALILRIDADTVIVSSVAFINSPPFVPMIAAAMKNRNVLAGGLAIGVVGYAVGNYLGFIIAELLSRL